MLLEVRTMGDLISRNALLDAMPKNDELLSVDVRRIICESPKVDAEPVITGETSDGYHTFNELYHHRAVLFSVIVKAFPERAWKARKHHDGTMYSGMFIVGIDTPEGQASYHYDIDPYWDIFECRELERALEWDGHTSAQAIERIRKLEPAIDAVEVVRCRDCKHTTRSKVSPEKIICCLTKMCGTVDPDFFCADGEREIDAEVE